MCSSRPCYFVDVGLLLSCFVAFPSSVQFDSLVLEYRHDRPPYGLPGELCLPVNIESICLYAAVMLKPFFSIVFVCQPPVNNLHGVHRRVWCNGDVGETFRFRMGPGHHVALRLLV